MQRLAVVIVAILIGTAGPARAWCGATCLAPASAETHCPTHEPASAGTAIAASSNDNCPALESARPTTIGRLELKAAIVTLDAPQLTPAGSSLARLDVALPASTVFQRRTPLRI